MADKIIEDLRQKLNKIELTVMDGEKQITFENKKQMEDFMKARQLIDRVYTELFGDEQLTFETVEQLEAYKKGRKLLEEVYVDLVLNEKH